MKTVGIVALVLAVALLLWLGLRGGGSADVKALETRVIVLQKENAALRGQRIPRTDTLYRTQRDTLRLTRTRTDSVLKTDTLWRVERVRELVAGERAACDRVVATCEVRIAQRDTALARADTITWAKDSVIDLLKKPCSYLGIGGPCPEVSVFGGVATTGKPVLAVGVSFPVKKLRVRF